MGDVHGEYSIFIKLLKHLNLTNGESTIQLRDGQQFIQIGDVLDRGSDGVKVLKYMMESMKENDNVDLLLG